MDFVTAPEILEALRERLDHGVFGYTIPHDSIEAVINYLDRQHGYSAKLLGSTSFPALSLQSTFAVTLSDPAIP